MIGSGWDFATFGAGGRTRGFSASSLREGPNMPIARIEVRRSRSPEEVQALIEAVYQAQREALKVPEGDRSATSNTSRNTSRFRRKKATTTR
jgi:hypothetical protein